MRKSSGKKIAAVFDYKRKPKSYSWQEFYYGLDMQLAIYMLAVRHIGSKFGIEDVAGAFYMPVEAEIKSVNLDELTKGKRNLVIRPKAFSTANTSSSSMQTQFPAGADFIISVSPKKASRTAIMVGVVR